MQKDLFEHHFQELFQLEQRGPQQEYLLFHKDRYQYLMGELGLYLPTDGKKNDFRVLDIGPAYQTYLIRALFDAPVNTMGFDHPVNRRNTGENHFRVDLNYTSRFNDKVVLHDLIIFSEVIEHLFTPVEEVMQFILQFLKPGGCIILQTPNAVSSFKRMKMMVGYNPFELLRPGRDGHFREYTVTELCDFFISLGLTVIRVDCRNYFNYPGLYQKVYRWLNRMLPDGFKDGITITGRKPGTSQG